MKMSLALAGFCAALAASPAFAAPDSDAAGAECVVDNAGVAVSKLLDTVPGSPAEVQASKAVLAYWGGCNDNVVASGSLAWRERAALADAALKAKLARRKPDLTAASDKGWSLPLVSGSVAGSDYDATSVGMRQFGDCVVRKEPQAALDLVRSPVGSKEENAAIAALSPSLSGCITAGQNVRLKRDNLRLLLAEPLYHVITR